MEKIGRNKKLLVVRDLQASYDTLTAAKQVATC